MDRRTFITTTAAVGTTVVAGCGASSDSSGSDDGGSTDGTSTESGSTTGTFRLLISDQPADISDFDSLDVTFDRARVFRTQGDDETETEATEETDEEEDGEDEETETQETETPEPTEQETTEPEETDEDEAEEDEADEDEADEEEDDDEEDGEGGFTVFELDDPTVDLTAVVGDKAIGVLDGKLETGEYSKIELYVSDVEGIVDGETVPVKVPSNKLQITKPFEVTAEEPVEFVFDINVVKKGNGGYNLLPVISESGVAGKDVEVEEIEEDGDDKEDEDESTEMPTETDTPTNETAETDTTTNETGA